MSQTDEKINNIQSVLNEMQNNTIYIEQAFKHLEIDFISNEKNKEAVVECILNNLNSPDSFLNKITTKFRSIDHENNLIQEFTNFELEIKNENEEKKVNLIKNWWDGKLGKINNFEVLSWFRKEIYSLHFLINDLKIYMTVLLVTKKQSSLTVKLIEEINKEVDLSYNLIKSIYASFLSWDLSGNGGGYIICKFVSLILDVIHKNFLGLINKLKNFLILKKREKKLGIWQIKLFKKIRMIQKLIN